MHFYDDDTFSMLECPCSGCDQKDWVINKSAEELKELQRIYIEWKKKSAAFENLMEGMIEDLCYTIGIEFKITE